MESWSARLSTQFGSTDPLSEAEIGELAIALQKLAGEGSAVPAHLVRHDYQLEGTDIRNYRSWGRTLDVVPQALERLGDDRERVVTGLIGWYERAVRDYRERVPFCKTDEDQLALMRPLNIAVLFKAAKPKTKESAVQVAEFLRSELHEVRTKAAEMLDGVPYFTGVVDELFKSLAARRWPEPSHACSLASHAEEPGVRQRLLDCLHAENFYLRHGAIMTFGYLRKKAGPQAESELFAIARNEDDKLRAAAMSALHEIVPQSGELRLLAVCLIRSGKYGVGTNDIGNLAIRASAISCLKVFSDRESIEALLTALLDEDEHDHGDIYDNMGNAERALAAVPLDADQALEPLIAALEVMLAREDKSHGVSPDDVLTAPVVAPQYSWSAPNGLVILIRLLGKLGAGARPAIPLIERCLARSYVAGSHNAPGFRELLHRIETG